MTKKNKFLGLIFLGSCIVSLSYLIAYSLGDTRLAWWLASTLHFSGGFYAVFFLKNLFNLTQKYHQTQTKWRMKLIFFVCGALVLGVFWEWYEFFFIYWDRIFLIKQEQTTLAIYADTMSDLFVDLLGALTAAAYLWIRGKQSKSSINL